MVIFFGFDVCILINYNWYFCCVCFGCDWIIFWVKLGSNKLVFIVYYGWKDRLLMEEDVRIYFFELKYC